MKKIFFILSLTCLLSAWQTPIINEDIQPDKRVALYIPARLNSERLPKKLLLPIDGKTIIERTYERAKLVRRAHRVCVVTDSIQIAALIGKDAQLIEKEYHNGTERVCDAFLNNSEHKEEIIVIIDGNEPYIEPSLIDYAIQKFLELERDKSIAAVFLHREIPVQEAATTNREKVTVDHNNCLISTCSHPIEANYNQYVHTGIKVYRAKALKEFYKNEKAMIDDAENLEWIKFLEMGYTIKSFKVANPIESRVDTLEDFSMLSEKYAKPRIYLLRSGGFSDYFVRKTNTLWPIREGDLVSRCKRTSFNNRELFTGYSDYVFFRKDKDLYIDLQTLKSKTFTVNPTDSSVALLYFTSHKDSEGFNLKQFCDVNGFQTGKIIDRDLVKIDFETDIGPLKMGRQIPSLGFVALSYLRRNFPEYLIVLIDFTFQEGSNKKSKEEWGKKQHADPNITWSNHNWDKEKEYAIRLEKKDYLIRLLDRVHTI